MSLIGDPAVIFLDEPTTGLDPEARQGVWRTVERLAHGGTTVLLTSQYLEEAERLVDRLAVLHEGRIIADDTLAGLMALLPPTRTEYVVKQTSLEGSSRPRAAAPGSRRRESWPWSPWHSRGWPSSPGSPRGARTVP